MPEDRRSAANYDDLAELAAALGRPAESLTYVENAIARTSSESPAALHDRKLDRIAALLRLGRTDDAIKVSEQFLAASQNGSDDLVQVGDLFGDAGLIDKADEYFANAWKAAGANRTAKSDVLRREAQWHAGARRWRILLKAALLEPSNQRERDALVKLVVREMSTADDAIIADSLAKESKDPAITVPLLIREAELTPWPPHATEIGLELHNSGRLPADRFDWLIGIADKGGQYADVIRLLEARLRSWQRLSDAQRVHLAHAYRQSGRDPDANRAERDASEIPRPAKPPERPQGAMGMSGGFF